MGALFILVNRGGYSFGKHCKTAIFPSSTPYVTAKFEAKVLSKGEQDRRALAELAKEAKRKQGILRTEADTLVKWGKEVSPNTRNVIDPLHSGSTNYHHAHAGGVDHIKIKD